MTVQENVGASIAYKVESTFGSVPGATGAKYIRRVSSALSLTKDPFSSNEVRPDQQVASMRHGVRRVGGSVEGELSTQSWDDWLEAAMRGTWATGTSLSESQLTSVAADNSASTLTFAAGDPVSLGLRAGDVIVLGGSLGGNENTNFRIASFGGTSNRTVTVSPAPATFGAVTSFTLVVKGKKLVNGTTRRSFTIEQIYSALDYSERFVGCRIGGFNLRVPPNGMATISWPIIGRDGSLLKAGSSPYFTSITDAPTTDVLAGPQGALRIAGVDRAVVTGIDLSLALGLTSQPVVGANVVPDIFYGRSVVTGNVSAYLDDDDLIDAFLAESEVDIHLVLESGTTGPLDFLSFNMQRVKLQGASKTLTGDDGVIVSFPFQALLANQSDSDASTLVIQRSNS